MTKNQKAKEDCQTFVANNPGYQLKQPYGGKLVEIFFDSKLIFTAYSWTRTIKLLLGHQSCLSIMNPIPLQVLLELHDHRDPTVVFRKYLPKENSNE